MVLCTVLRLPPSLYIVTSFPPALLPSSDRLSRGSINALSPTSQSAGSTPNPPARAGPSRLSSIPAQSMQFIHGYRRRIQFKSEGRINLL
ncbi:hypothetical protein B0H19DRAFT_1121338, partial [Mycena capillaripes]